jgi:SagB-type dehydrogenase family enzyme
MDFFNYPELYNQINDQEMRSTAWFINYKPNDDYLLPPSIYTPAKYDDVYELRYKRPEEEKDLFDIIRARKSSRLNHLDKPWTLEELSVLLEEGLGLRGEARTVMKENKKEKIEFRMYPSGGSLYPVHIFLYINKLPSVQSGFYYYSVTEKKLYRIHKGIIDSDYEKLFPMSKYKLDQDNCDVLQSAFSLFFIADYYYAFNKYGKLSNKLCLLECGHMAQNLLLITTALKKNSLPICGYFRDKVEDYLGLANDPYKFCHYSIIFG